MTLKEARIKSGLTQKQVAERLGITEQAYQAYEYGKNLPNVRLGLELAKVVNCSAEDIWTIRQL